MSVVKSSCGRIDGSWYKESHSSLVSIFWINHFKTVLYSINVQRVFRDSDGPYSWIRVVHHCAIPKICHLQTVVISHYLIELISIDELILIGGCLKHAIVQWIESWIMVKKVIRISVEKWHFYNTIFDPHKKCVIFLVWFGCYLYQRFKGHFES